MTKRAIELIRVSTAGQATDDKASIPAQHVANKRTASAYGLEIVKTIEISDVSGAAVLYAPEIQDMIRLMDGPHIHGVVTREFSRLMRPENFEDFILLQVFVKTNTVLYLPDGPIDFASRTGRLVGTIRAAIAGLERTDLLERVWSAKEEKRREGKFAQSSICLPFGVGYEEGRGWFYTPDAERVREAFGLLLSGDTGYWSVGRKVGLEPTNLRVILRNPIYSGWRVIDKRRDPSPSALRVKRDGRQGDRPKIKRAPEDVIRVRVIDDPLIKEADFRRAQEILDVKRARHWRSHPGYERRFTYNGFLTCAACGQLVYTKFQRDDYYVCKGRHLRRGCPTRSMRRDRLEPMLDALFSSRLTDREFLKALANEHDQGVDKQSAIERARRLEGVEKTLRAKRGRVLEAFIDGAVDREWRDDKLAKVDREIEANREMIEREKPAQVLSTDELHSLFAPFYEWGFLDREEKRQLLSTVVPEIRVADYQIKGLYLSAPFFCSGNENLTGKGSSRPRA